MEYELQHWGIKGMRWGIRRYQNRDGSLTAAGKKRVSQQKVDNLAKARQAKANKKQHEEDKQKALKTGSASEVLKYKDELTPQEMTAAWNRIQWERNMSSVAANEVSAGKAKVNQIFKSLDDATNKASTAIKAWNTFANVYNALSDTKVSLPKISTDVTNDNKNQRNTERKEQQKIQEAAKKVAKQKAQQAEKQKERADKKAAEAAKNNDAKAKKTDDKVYEGVIIDGNSKPNNSSNNKQQKAAKDYVDAEWREVKTSNLPVNYEPLAQAYLEELKRKK